MALQITPEMIAAGVNAYEGFDSRVPIEEVVSKVYEAMDQARPDVLSRITYPPEIVVESAYLPVIKNNTIIAKA